jgi:hypothetical protein
MFWEEGCNGQSSLSPLMREFAETHQAELRRLRKEYIQSPSRSPEEAAARDAMKDLYHNFIKNKGVDLEAEFAKIANSFSGLVKEAMTV